METGRSVLKKVKRLFVIKTRFEAYLIIFALALGAMTRGAHYTLEYPGVGGYLLFPTLRRLDRLADAQYEAAPGVDAGREIT